MKTITIELNDEAEKRFNDLMRRSKSKNDQHLIDKALATYNFLVEGKTKENIVIIKTAWGNREFRIT